MRAGCSLLASLLVVSSCAEPTIKIDGYEMSDATHMTVYLAWCGSHPALAVEESDTTITIDAEPGEEIDGDCQASGSVTLKQPIGERRVVDGSTDTEVPVLE